MIRLALALCIVAISGCVGSVERTDPCSVSSDPMSCADCVNSPPHNVGGLPVTETFSGPSGSTCGSVATSGVCHATYFDGTKSVTALCGPY